MSDQDTVNRYDAAVAAGLPNPHHASLDDAGRARLREVMLKNMQFDTLRPDEQDDVLHGRCIWHSATMDQPHQILDYGNVIRKERVGYVGG